MPEAARLPTLGGCLRLESLIFCLLLRPTLLLPQEQPGGETEGASLLHLNFEPRTWTLNWKCQANITVSRCSMKPTNGQLANVKPREAPCACQFQGQALHAGATLRVEALVHATPVQEQLLFVNAGQPGTAARNFSCLIYSAAFLNCSWARGSAAPSDIQYFLYIKDTKKKTEMECPQYVRDAGVHTGCHMRNLSGLPYHSYFLVYGTSQQMAVQFYDEILNSKKIERLDPPTNISVTCNATHCCVMWRQPDTWTRLSSLDFQYQLDIQREDVEPHKENPLIPISNDVGNMYIFPSPEPRAKHTVRIQTGDVRISKWSEWSAAVKFGSKKRRLPLLGVHLVVVFVTVVCTLTLGFLCRRFLRTWGLLSPVPHIKDKISDNQQILGLTLVPQLGKVDSEEIVTVEEVARPCSHGP